MATIEGYWERFSAGKQRRRRFLQTGATLGAGAIGLGLVGCGGDDADGGDARGLVSEPRDTSNKAVRGGSIPLSENEDVNQYNTEGSNSASFQALHAYARMVKFKTFKYPDKGLPVTEGDAMSSWEVSGDGLTVTFKLRPNQKFDPRSPTNGRVMTTQDVQFSWDRFDKINPLRANLSNRADPSAPVTSVTTPDSGTVVMKLAFPYAPLLPMLAYVRHVAVLPVEADDKFKTGEEVRGSSTWRIKEIVRSARIVWEANQDWYDYSKVLPKEIVYTLITEYNAGLAQFRTGALATYDVNAEDILATKRDLPKLLMIPQEDHDLGGNQLRFGWLPESPWRDERVRQANSLLMDRDLIIDTFYNTKQFEDAGLDVPRRWHTVLPSGADGFWLDPQGKEFGPNAKYYQYDPAEAKRLVRAAGHTGPVQGDWIWTANGYGPEFQRLAEVLHQMWEAGGDFKLKTNNPDFQTEWRNNYNRNFGRFVGLSLGAGGGSPEIDGWIVGRLLSPQERTGHLGADGKPDEALNAMIASQRKELDAQKRQAIIYDIQRYCAKTQYTMFAHGGDALGFFLGWPWYANWRVFRSAQGGVAAVETDPFTWIDESKRKKS